MSATLYHTMIVYERVIIRAPAGALTRSFLGSAFGQPSVHRGAKLCTYLRWFARPDTISTEPYYELPLPVTKLRSIFHFRVGAHSLPVEQGRIAMPKAGLRCHGICAGAHFVQPMLSVMSAIVCLIALIFRAFGSSMQ